MSVNGRNVRAKADIFLRFDLNRSIVGPFYARVGFIATHVRRGHLAMGFANLDIYPACSLFFLPPILSSSSSPSSNLRFHSNSKTNTAKMSGILPLSDLPQLLPRGTCHSVNATCPVSKSFYGYTPALGPNVALLVIFSLALVAHGVQGIYYRAWGTLIAMGWGCVCEVLGYAGRLMMHPNAFNLNGLANTQTTRVSRARELTRLQVSNPDMPPHDCSCVLLCSNLYLLVKTVSGISPCSGQRSGAEGYCDSVLLFGTEVSRLSPKQYAYIFIGCDIVSLALQGQLPIAFTHY